jgi:hypothetical protein
VANDDRLACRRGRLGSVDDQPDDLLEARLAPDPGSCDAPEIQDREAVRDVPDVAQVVADEDDGGPVCLQVAHELHHLLGLGDTERRGRLVHDHELGAVNERPRDRHRLPLTAGEQRDGDANGGKVDADALEQLLGLGAATFLVDEGASRELRAEEKVGGDVAGVDQRQILVDRRDAGFHRVLGAGQGQGLTVEQQLALVRRVETGDDLDQRGLARAVVAEQGQDLAGADLEVDVLERLHVTERLADAPCLQERLGAVLVRHVHLAFRFRATELSSTASTNTIPVSMYCM